jgi:methylenetetrahydrofolate dehydrogenase (NADP+)/methenyltetrahydrofolate cyclohydrolase
MPAQVLDGRPVANRILEEVAAGSAELAAIRGRPPALVAVGVGDDPATRSYFRSIGRLAEKAAIRFEARYLPADVSTDGLIEEIRRLNVDPAVDGILVQMPLPAHLDAARVAETLDPKKDVDGITPDNAGRLFLGRPQLVPSTPVGGLEVLRAYGIPIEGRRAVVVGRSNILGKPLALMLLNENATVTVCHTRTRNLAEVTREAEILCVGAGRPGLITADMVRPGAVVLDFGTNWTERGLVGDVDFEAVKEVAGAITPVPGGIGPVTTAVLLRNTLEAARRH